MRTIIDWHKSFVEKAQKQLGISNYALYWFGFFEGALVMWVLMKILAVFISRSHDPFFN